MLGDFILAVQFICRKLPNQFNMRIFLLLLTCLIVSTAQAQTTEDSVKATVNRLFTGMRNSDVEMMKSVFSDNAILQSISETKEGTKVTTDSVKEFAESIKDIAKGDADEQLTWDLIKIDDGLAIVWAPYKFFYKGKFSHCGVDSFQLVRINGVWKIQYIIDTRRRSACL
jgi:hypothetical protein